MSTTRAPDEIAKFEALAATWWDERGPFRPLHEFNPTRLQYLQDTVQRHFAQPVAGLSLLDVGCGGGLLAEPLARLGAAVTGIDAAAKNIAIAETHAAQTATPAQYTVATAEEQAATGQTYDIVLAMEIVEHVADVPLFLQSCAALVRPGGLLVVSTLNRTAKSWLLAIVGAEYILRWLPRGTHDWKKFLTPAELAAPLEKAGLRVIASDGMTYNPLARTWAVSRDMSVNYILACEKSS